MSNYWKHIDDFFREKLGRYRETPPPDVWEALDKQLDGLIPSPTTPSAPRPSFRWLGHLAMVSLVAVLSIPLVKKLTGSKATQATAVPVEAPVAANTANAPVAATNVVSAVTKEQPGSDKDAGTSADASSAAPALIAAVRSQQPAETSYAKTPVRKKNTAENKSREKRNTGGNSKTSTAKGGKTENDGGKPPAKTNNYNSGKANTGSGIAAKEKEATTTTTKQTQPAPKTPPAKEIAKKAATKKAEVKPAKPPFTRV